MDWTTLFFSFRGRLNRGKYWLAVLTYMIAWGAFYLGIMIWLGGLTTDNLFRDTGTAILIILIGAILFVAAVWSGLAVGVKRLHDREKSGWWIVLFWIGPGILSNGGNMTAGVISLAFSLATIILSVWATVELGFLRGTNGPNDYGPDPLAPAYPLVT